MDKIIKTYEYKIQLREKEIAEADKQVERDNFKEEKPKKETKLDPFFQSTDCEIVEKRVVNRDGIIPKLKKNIEKEAREQAEREEKMAIKKMEKQWGKRPIKINPSNYRVKGKVEGEEKTNKHILL